MKKLAFLCGLIATFWGAALSAQEQNLYPPMPFFPVVAHAGFSFVAPENTMSAMRAAVAAGADACEMDLHQTGDGVIFLYHDSSLKRPSGEEVAVTDLTFEELQQFDAGAWKGEEFKGEKYPALDEVLDLLSQSNVGAVIEIKVGGFEEKLVETVRAHHMERNTVLIDFSAERVKKFRQIAPDIPCAWLVAFDGGISTDEACTQIEKTLQDCGTNLVDMHFGRTSAELVERLASHGIEVMVWTVDDPDDIARLYGYGVCSITTDRPDLALELLKTNPIGEKKVK